MPFPITANEDSINRIKEEYTKSNTPWFIGFSGGKDSSAVLKLTFLSLLQIKNPKKPIIVVYCDTGVDVPIINELVIKTLNNIQVEATEYNIPLSFQIVIPPTKDKFFSKVIGRGFPTPTNIFRWCTDRLRINPVNRYLNSISQKEKIVLLGIRKGESLERDKIIVDHEKNAQNYYKQSRNSSATIFAPILDYSTEDVWATVAYNPIPKSVDAVKLMSLYRQASGECPIIRDPRGTPCGQGRFGCWTCTVVRKDKSITSLVNEGYIQLKPLLDFRNWLMEIRDDCSYRLPKRRNGSEGPGPFTIKARQEILMRLFEAEDVSRYSLIDNAQLDFIHECWEKDFEVSKSVI